MTPAPRTRASVLWDAQQRSLRHDSRVTVRWQCEDVTFQSGEVVAYSRSDVVLRRGEKREERP